MKRKQRKLDIESVEKALTELWDNYAVQPEFIITSDEQIIAQLKRLKVPEAKITQLFIDLEKDGTALLEHNNLLLRFNKMEATDGNKADKYCSSERG